MTQLPPQFEIDPITAGVPDGTAALALAGELDITATSAFRDAVAAEPEARRLVLDVSEVTFMDSSMLKELLRARGVLAEREGELVLVAPQEPVQRLLDITRAGELVRVVGDREAALG